MIIPSLNMQITILKPGIFSTVQDLGRQGYLGQGVPLSGAADQLSAVIANCALGNDANAATIEFTYANVLFKADTDLLICYCGEGAYLEVAMQIVPAERPVFLPAGTQVRLKTNPSGVRTSLAIAGGWDVPEVMGSSSTYVTAGFGGYAGRTLRTGDVLVSKILMPDLAQKLCQELMGDELKFTKWAISQRLLRSSDRKSIRIVPGNEFSWFDSDSVLSFLSSEYTITRDSNRMGCHLHGPTMKRNSNTELLSTAVLPGTVQVSGDGSLILLLADCQTTGGYPRIAQVAAVDLPKCAQLKPGDQINFIPISKEEAEISYIDQRNELLRIKSSIANRY